jgi:hypothetical protein
MEDILPELFHWMERLSRRDQTGGSRQVRRRFRYPGESMLSEFLVPEKASSR